MLRNWKMIDLAGLFAIALASAPAMAGGDKDKESTDLKTVLKRLDGMDSNLAKLFKEISKDMTDIKKDVSDLKTDHLMHNVEMDKLTAKIDKLEKQLAKLQGEKKSTDVAANYPPADKASLDEIKNRLGQIEQAMLKIQQPNRISLSPAGSGRVMFVNLYNEELLFTVNGRPYRVGPNRSMPIDNVPSGTFTYEVVSSTYGLMTQRTSALSPNETVTISAR